VARGRTATRCSALAPLARPLRDVAGFRGESSMRRHSTRPRRHRGSASGGRWRLRGSRAARNRGGGCREAWRGRSIDKRLRTRESQLRSRLYRNATARLEMGTRLLIEDMVRLRACSRRRREARGAEQTQDPAYRVAHTSPTREPRQVRKVFLAAHAGHFAGSPRGKATRHATCGREPETSPPTSLGATQ